MIVETLFSLLIETMGDNSELKGQLKGLRITMRPQYLITLVQNVLPTSQCLMERCIPHFSVHDTGEALLNV